MSSEGTVRLDVRDAVAAVVFDRPAAHNAMTPAMYAQLVDICERLREDRSVRVATFRGAGGRAFVAGADIAQFQDFVTDDDGVAYERRVDRCVDALEALPMPTVALVEGYAVGGGLVLATACDFRLATASAKFGVPIARTVGNCLSMGNLARLTAAFGIQRVKRMLLAAELLDAEEALACGFVHRVCEAQALDGEGARLCATLASLAPLTQAASKEGLRRLALASLPDGEDLIRRVYGSDDFREGVAAFLERRAPRWRGA